ncbi:MAG: ABC transporter permease [SAR202 cluster bacterium]|nr:ABC transporter permease [Chloroflexota bacterium]MQG38444.1 ABC transporter permease [SAR202 cluster bacterium]|tara:strand:+ start:415 stop:1410 length:996 start_codon:yes stop_codon:yes gene_type:complete
MVQYITKRFFLGLLTIWVITIISWVIIELPPGDFVTYYVDVLLRENADSPLGRQMAETLREQLGWDKPSYYRYGKWMWNMLQGDLGKSLVYEPMPVTAVISERLLMTVILAVSTAILAWGLAIPIGIYSAVRQRSPEDYLFTFVGFLGLAVPDFLLALWLLWISFAVFNQSVGGLFSPDYLNAPWSFARLIDLLSHLWIACLVVGTAGTASLIRVMRANLLDELNKPYVTTAIAKGLHEWKAILKYPVRLAINPLISTLGYLLPYLISGSIIVSVVLNLPTEGPLLLKALFNEDLFVSAAIILILGTMTVIGTFISDILLAVVDPRIRFTR